MNMINDLSHVEMYAEAPATKARNIVKMYHTITLITKIVQTIVFRSNQNHLLKTNSPGDTCYLHVSKTANKIIGIIKCT